MISVLEKEDYHLSTGTGFKQKVYLTYNQLVGILGEPTLNMPSGDGKVQVEWIVEFEGEIFTIYDWKTYDRAFTLNKLNQFHVGGKTYAGDFVEYLVSMV